MKADYKRLVVALSCNGDNVAEENLGCGNKRCQYRDADGACDIVGMCNDAAKAISDLLARAEKAESNLDAAQRLLAEKSGVNGMEKVETCFGYTLDKVRELVEADKDGRCVPVTKDLLIAIMAGLYALNTNKKMRGGMYVFDVHKEHGGPHTMEFSRAAQILAETAERVLDASDDVLTGKEADQK